MANLYSVYIQVIKHTDSIDDMVGGMYFVGIFDKKHLVKGILKYIYEREREIAPDDVQDREVVEFLQLYINNVFLQTLLNNPNGMCLDLENSLYVFYINEVQVNTVNNILLEEC